MPSMPRIQARGSDAPSRVARARLGRGLRQADLAQRAGVSRQYVSKIECEGWTPPLVRQEALATALGAPIKDLFPPTNDERPVGTPGAVTTPANQGRRGGQ